MRKELSHFLTDFVVFFAGSDDPEHAFAQIGARHGNGRKVEGFGLRAA